MTIKPQKIINKENELKMPQNVKVTEEVNKVGHYRSWYDVAKKLTDPNDRLAFYDALDAYRFDGVELENLPPMVDILMTAIKPSIDADINNRITGGSGGTKKGENARVKKQKADDAVSPVKEETSEPVEESGCEEEKKESFEETENAPIENKETRVPEENKAPLTENEKGATEGGYFFERKQENTPLFEKKYPPISNSDSKEEVEEEVEAEEDDDDKACAESVTSQAVENWLELHELTLPDKDMKKITTSLVLRNLELDYLDYALKYVSSKSYKSRDGTGNIRFVEIPEGNRKGLFIDAVMNWQDITHGYEAWHKDRVQKEKLCPVQKTPPKPVNCPWCGGPLYENSGESICVKCNGYLEWGGKGWRISPFPQRTLAEGIKQMSAIAS